MGARWGEANLIAVSFWLRRHIRLQQKQPINWGGFLNTLSHTHQIQSTWKENNILLTVLASAVPPFQHGLSLITMPSFKSSAKIRTANQMWRQRPVVIWWPCYDPGGGGGGGGALNPGKTLILTTYFISIQYVHASMPWTTHGTIAHLAAQADAISEWCQNTLEEADRVNCIDIMKVNASSGGVTAEEPFEQLCICVHIVGGYYPWLLIGRMLFKL